MIQRLHRLALRGFRALPTSARRAVVRTFSPSFTVGSIVVIVSANNRSVVLVHQSYRHGWGLPGGLLKRGEDPSDAAVRETFEEIGCVIRVEGEPVVVIESAAQRVDVVFLGRLVDSDDDPRPTSAEIVAARWFPVDDLPELQHETRQAIAKLVVEGRLDSPFVGGAANLS